MLSYLQNVKNKCNADIRILWEKSAHTFQHCPRLSVTSPLQLLVMEAIERDVILKQPNNSSLRRLQTTSICTSYVQKTSLLTEHTTGSECQGRR